MRQEVEGYHSLVYPVRELVPMQRAANFMAHSSRVRGVVVNACHMVWRSMSSEICAGVADSCKSGSEAAETVIQ